MPDHFVGLMPPQMFLDAFLNTEHAPPGVPDVDFSQIPAEASVDDMRVHFVKAVERSGLCPGARLFIPRMTKRQVSEASMERSKRSGHKSRDREKDGTSGDVVPALAVRTHCRPRRKPANNRNLVEYCNFATYLLGIDVQADVELDPFMDPGDDIPPSDDTDPAASPQEEYMRTSPSETLSFVTGYVPEHSPSYGPLPPRPPRSGNQGRAPQPEPRSSPQHHSVEHREATPKTPPACGIHSPGQRDNIVERGTPIHRTPSPKRETPSAQKPETPAGPSTHSVLIERPTRKAAAVRSAIVSHAGTQSYRQHRRFLFHLVLLGQFARFIRFDRSGALVSERFDYVSTPGLLAQFFWRFAHMTDDERGWDSSATLASKSETRQFTEAVENFVYGSGRKVPNAERTLDAPGSFPTWKIRVTNASTGDSTALIVRRPFAGQTSLFGRSTRAYIALDISCQRLVFFKDSWRADRSYLRPEFQTFLDLRAHGVPHIPEVLYGGDVQEADGSVQDTLASALSVSAQPWRTTTAELYRHVHHRIVQEIYYPLASAVSVREYLQALHDALIAVDRAHEQAGVLHRDISYRNIMLDSDGHGVLNDWDHAGTEKESANGIGTWEFMSIRLLLNWEQTHELVDDLESFYWVLVFGALKQFALPDQYLPFNIFNYRLVKPDGRVVGGEKKQQTIHFLHNTVRDVRFGSEPLRALIADMRARWYDHERALEGAPDVPLNSPYRDEILAMAHLALKPGYWAGLIASAVEALGASEAPTEDRPLPVVTTRHALRGSPAKRKTEITASTSHYDIQHPRRSKRLKAMHCRTDDR